jgi:uncharacterized protein (TIGR02246 family)
MTVRFAALALGASLFALPVTAQDTPDALADAFCAAVVAEDKDALAALYTEDADSYGPDGSVVAGNEAIGESWVPFFAAFDDLTCTLEKAGLVKEGKHATAWGLWTIAATSAADGAPVVMKGRFMDIAIKTKDGWRYRADHASMMAAAE